MMAKTAVGLLASWMLILAAGGAASAQDSSDHWDARLTEAKGQVTVYTTEEPEGVPAEKDMPLEAGDRVRTGEDSSAEIALDANHVLSLKDRSDFTLTAVRRMETEFSLSLGSLLAKIGSLLGSQNLRVRTPAAVASVRGTEFGVEVDPENPEETHVGVFDEGKVEVAGQAGPPENLISNQETRVLRGGRPLPAYQLKRFVRHRRFMRAFRKRAQALRKSWRALPPEKRRELRQKTLERMRERREKLRERLKERPRKTRRERPEERPDRKKMEKFREEIRRRRRRP